jgi:hypothetical protein
MMVINELKERLDIWFSERPQAHTSNFGFGSLQWVTLNYHHSVLLLHRQQLVAHAQASFPPSTEMALLYVECAESGSTLCRTYQQFYFGVTIGYTTGALHVLFLGGLTFLYCLWVSEDCRRTFRRDAVSSSCTACTVALAIMTERWSAAQPFRDTFQLLAEATQSMLAHIDDVDGPRPLLPVLDAQKDSRLPQHLSDIGGIGMDASVEHLLGQMIRK